MLIYDRRGHSRSERPATQGSFDEDGDDLAALLEALELAPAHVVTNSGGGNIALRLATRRADVFRSLSCTSRRYGACSRRTPRARRCCSRRSQPRGGRQADRRGRSRGRGAAVRRGGRLRSWRVGERATARDRSDLRPNAPTALDELQAQPVNIDEALSRLNTGASHGGSESPRVPTVLDRLVELIPRVTRETDRRRRTRTPTDDARALRRGHDARSAAARGSLIRGRTAFAASRPATPARLKSSVPGSSPGLGIGRP